MRGDRAGAEIFPDAGASSNNVSNAEKKLGRIDAIRFIIGNLKHTGRAEIISGAFFCFCFSFLAKAATRRH
jgi:hypothetical protein